MKSQINASTLEILKGDLTALAVDAIVNAANTHLQHGGGVAGTISRRGGPTIQQESDVIIEQRGELKTGEAVITGGGTLPAKFVIHTAGPIWGDQSPAEADALLRASIRNSLALADEKKLTSIAFPAISTGIYHFPVDRAAKLMLAEVKRYLAGETGLQRVIFCLYDEPTYRVFAEVFN